MNNPVVRIRATPPAAGQEGAWQDIAADLSGRLLALIVGPASAAFAPAAVGAVQTFLADLNRRLVVSLWRPPDAVWRTATTIVTASGQVTLVVAVAGVTPMLAGLVVASNMALAARVVFREAAGQPEANAPLWIRTLAGGDTHILTPPVPLGFASGGPITVEVTPAPAAGENVRISIWGWRE